MSGEPGIADVAALLDDECVRCILVHTHNEPMSANDLVERCDASGPTVYRRLSDLQEHDFLIEQTHPDAEGHHYKVYQANLDRVTINLTDEGFEVTVKRAETMANRFTQLIEEM